MNKEQFEHVLSQWPHLRFSEITTVKYFASHELYAIDRVKYSCRLFLCREYDERSAQKTEEQLRQWLKEFNYKQDVRRITGEEKSNPG
ncbi:hypothetical protein ACIP6T_23550 [Pantoea sp. NPDC088449]|uniref:Uncharacterized protein n=1 Tax=Candidatus Pantoea floridensis TaxID=1938870 RepID=A0A286DRE1_9GAMM|nr:hypothetical protein [Pantoea floridensis]PIF07497.1 hypothetical protein BX596_5009 [Enterobacteriaceae bacterium JKS000233]SOD61226.1 hypothetical protein SAMN06273570_5034 [Pantoea floridensis]